MCCWDFTVFLLLFIDLMFTIIDDDDGLQQSFFEK